MSSSNHVSSMFILAEDENDKIEDSSTSQNTAIKTHSWLKLPQCLDPKKKIILILFGFIPFLLIVVGAVPMLASRYQGFVIRSIFFLSVCLFPATLYYLFISTRKYSLLDEFVDNLERLGLFDKKENESEIDHERRRNTYLQKFQGVYGQLPEKMINEINEGKTRSLSMLTKIEFFTPETTLPVVFATLLIAIGWIIILPPWNHDSEISESVLGTFIPNQTPVNFAFLGAYFFSVQMLFRRYARRDLRIGAYVAVSLRIILSVIGIWTVETLLSKQIGGTQLTVLGFVIGVFPQTAWQFVQASTKKIGGYIIPSFKTPLPLRGLDGLTVWNEARLEEEDIENIPNMATAEIADLMLNTRISPDRIIDWVDQAILYTHLGPEEEDGFTKEQRQKLRSHGIRTATSLMEVCQKECNIGNLERLEMRSLEKSIKTNPNLKLIQTWKGAVGQNLVVQRSVINFADSYMM
jgi:hypothetical protein